MIKRLLFFVLCTFFLMITWSKGKEEAWIVEMESVRNFVAFCSAFDDSQFGLIGGHQGEFHRTTDSGESWVELERVNGMGCRYVIEAYKQNFIVTSGRHGTFYTLDQGENWTFQSSSFYPFVSFCDDSTGWMISPDEWVVTYDGLNTWEEISPPAHIDEVIGLSIVSKDGIWILDKGGSLHFSEDGGQSWKALDITGELEKQGFQPNLNISQMRFFDQDRGILMFMDRQRPFRWLVCETMDGGSNWSVSSLQRESGGVPYISHDLNHITLLEDQDYQALVVLLKRRAM